MEQIEKMRKTMRERRMERFPLRGIIEPWEIWGSRTKTKSRRQKIKLRQRRRERESKYHRRQHRVRIRRRNRHQRMSTTGKGLRVSRKQMKGEKEEVKTKGRPTENQKGRAEQHQNIKEAKVLLGSMSNYHQKEQTVNIQTTHRRKRTVE